MFDIGLTYEGRSTLGISICQDGCDSGKPKMWIDSGIHAREWISPSSNLYMIDSLLKGYGQDDQISKVLDELDWYFVPTVNPDGYVFTWEEDRTWRKNRSV